VRCEVVDTHVPRSPSSVVCYWPVKADVCLALTVIINSDQYQPVGHVVCQELFYLDRRVKVILWVLSYWC